MQIMASENKDENTLTNEELSRLYEDSKEVDQAIFAEMRSNILLVSGDHYNQAQRKKIMNSIRNVADISDEQKLRLTKNHIGKISAIHKNGLLTDGPDVTCIPNNETEMQDQKAAELHLAVLKDAKHKYKWSELRRKWADDFIDVGEVANLIIRNPSKGRIKGYEPVLDEEGSPLVDPMTGEMAPDESKPIFAGEFQFKPLHGFNLLRKKGIEDMTESPFLIYREMADVKEMKLFYKGDEEKEKLLEPSTDDCFIIFDASSGKYERRDSQVLILNFYFRPCKKYPKGYFYIKTPHGVLEQGELPGGIFPICFKTFRSVQTSPRGRSLIKDLRPYQIEVNRAASAIATHQITLGDDKVVTFGGGKLEPGSTLHGVRHIKATGMGQITHLPGRAGEQYVPYMDGQIQEMYQVALLNEEAMDKPYSQMEPWQMLFMSLKQKKRFSIYAEKFNEFLVDVATIYLELAKFYMDDDELIPAIGRQEMVNIPEFRNSTPLGFQIKVVPETEDLETQMGKQMVMSQTLQYVGGQLEKDDIGKILMNMPFANAEEICSDFTIDYDTARNDILAIERGQMRPPNRYDKHPYLIKKLVHRMTQSDFQFLAPQVQQMFEQKLALHQQMEGQIQAEIQRAQSGFIPTGGYLVKADFYIEQEDGKTKRAAVPYESFQWLMKKLNEQGMSQGDLENMQQGSLADIGAYMERSLNPGAVQPNTPPTNI